MNIQINLGDGTTINAFVENYNAAELAEKINNHQLVVVTIGDIIFNKNMIKTIIPVQE